MDQKPKIKPNKKTERSYRKFFGIIYNRAISVIKYVSLISLYLTQIQE